MKTKEELEEAIKDTIKGYKEIIFGSDTSTCMVCLDELRKQQIIDQYVYDQKLMNENKNKNNKSRMGRSSNKHCDG